MSRPSSRPRILTDAQVAHFLEHNYIVLDDCFSRDTAKDWIDDWSRRTGIDLTRPETYPSSFAFTKGEHVGRHADVRQVAPKVWDACCDLLGGEDRIDDPVIWTNAFVVNYGTPGSGTPGDPGGNRVEYNPPDHTRGGWHIDGDFNHFLDSPEQALLMIALWSDVAPRGGGTFIAPDSIGPVARLMHANPRGLPAPAFKNGLNGQCKHFVETLGPVGRVYLMHPFMLHSVAPNISGTPRLIRNGGVSLREPMRFNRADPAELSLVERATLRALGVDRLDFTTPPAELRSATDHHTGALLHKPHVAPRQTRLARIT